MKGYSTWKTERLGEEVTNEIDWWRRLCWIADKLFETFDYKLYEV